MKIRCPTCGKQYEINTNNFELFIPILNNTPLDFDNEDLEIQSVFTCPECNKSWNTSLVYRVTLRDVQIKGEITNKKMNIEFGGKNG